MFRVLVVVSFMVWIACNRGEEKQQSFEVGYHGALKNMMHEGDISANARLSDYQTTKNLYALGAIKNLKGEIQIFNSQPYNSYVSDGVIQFDSSYTKDATLLVSSVVTDWESFDIPEGVVTMRQFEKHIKHIASESGIDTKRPFPFLLTGIVDELSWHVIDWRDGDIEHSHEKHINSGLNGTINDAAVEMLGFYSEKHRGIFTHHTSYMHIHMRMLTGAVAGHVDEFKVGTQMTIMLPKGASTTDIM